MNCQKSLYKYIVGLTISCILLCLPARMHAVGWTPTDAGLVVNMEQGERFLLSVEINGKEYFVSNYNRASHPLDIFNYSAGSYLKLLPQDPSATEPAEMSIWSVGAPLTRVDTNNVAGDGKMKNYALGGIAYTIWNDGKTLKTNTTRYQFYGDLTSSYDDTYACDVVFVIPTVRGVPTVIGRDGLSSFDPNGTLGKGKAPFNGRMGTGFLGMTYREVYMFDIPRFNNPVSYTNAALVTFNTTQKEKSWRAGTIAKGHAAYAYADSYHDSTTRLLFRLYLLDDPINSCSSYFFATDEQDYKGYRTGPRNKDCSSCGWNTYSPQKKIYTMDRLTCMSRKGNTQYYQTDLMKVPEQDSTYYYVGYNNTYIDDEETMGAYGAQSNFTQIRKLPIFGLADTLKAPAGAIGRMVINADTTVDNLDVRFKPAGYFCKINTGTNIRMRPNADSTIWTCDEMWHITDAFAALQIKTTLFSGPEYSETDPGKDIPGWSVPVKGTTVPLAGNHSQHVTGGMDGWARIYTDSSQINGYMEFVLANPRYHIHYDYNGLLGTQLPDQYPMANDSTVTVEQPRLVKNFDFTGWNTKADGSGTTYQPNNVIDFKHLPEGVTLENDSVLTLYAQGSYTGTIHVALSFEHSNGKRYFLTQPVGETERYARARPVGDWTDTYQGMSDVYNSEPNYISTYKLLTGSTDCPHCASGEYVLDPRREMRYGAKDSLLFYENFAPEKEVYLGLYYDDPNTPSFKDPATVIANNTWAGLFTSSEGWPNYSRATVKNAKLRSTHYLKRDDNKEITRVLRPDDDSTTYVKYIEATNQFDGVKTEGEATEFQISRVRVADEHYVVLPDTTKVWRDTIEFGYHQDEQSREAVWTSLVGKQLMAVTIVGNDTVYFHPNPDKVIANANDLYLSRDFRVSQSFELIRDSRVSAPLNEGDSATYATTSNYWRNDIVSGMSSPINVTDGAGNYIDIVDTFRITLSQGGISKIKEYYGLWKKQSDDDGLTVNGLSRSRDVIVRTKTYHYGAPQVKLVLTPEFSTYIFNPLVGNSQQLNFTLTKEIWRQLLDVKGNPIGKEEIISTEDVTPSLGLTGSACSFSSGGTYFNIDEAHLQHIILSTKLENKADNNLDTLIISTSVTIGGETYPASVRIPLVQTSLEGDELIWSVVSGKDRYYIMAGTSGTNGLIFRKYAQSGTTLYKEGTTNTALIKGSKNAANDDKAYITPWHFSYNPSDATQLALKTEYGVNLYFKMLGNEVGSKAGTHVSDSSLLTFHYVDVLTNDNANEEEQVKLQYGSNLWLKFTQTGGSGAELVLVNSKDDASVFSWSYLNPEYSLHQKHAYPNLGGNSIDSVVFGYNTNMNVAIQTRYKAYKEFTMLVGNKMVDLCRVPQENRDSLVDPIKEWKTHYDIKLLPDNRTFDSGSDPSPAVSGISKISTDSELRTTVSTKDATTSPTDVKIGGKYVNIVDTLHVTLSLQTGAPAYRFKQDWVNFKSIKDAELKIPLIRMTYHKVRYDSVKCTVTGDKYNHTFPNTITSPVSYTFSLGTAQRTGYNVMDVENTIVDVQEAEEEDVTESCSMDLSSSAMAEIRLMDEFGNTPNWCSITGKTARTITVECTKSGIRSPRTAYIYIVYIVIIDDKMRIVSQRLTVSQPSLYQYANNQHLVHSYGASGDSLRADGMQQVHENKRILYYYPEQDVELPIRDSHFFGWWRWFREEGGTAGESDIPDSLWRTQPRNIGYGNNNDNYSYPFRIIGDSVDDGNGGKKLVTMGRYTVFHYRASQYKDNKTDPPVKTALVAPPDTTFGAAVKPIVTYAAEISNYYDKLPMSLSQKNQVDTAMLDTMRAIPEPTLSLREVFELRPWTEMAARMDSFKTEIPGDNKYPEDSYMEDHKMMAPIKNELLLSTEQRYNYENLQTFNHSESLLGYYMRDDNWNTDTWDAARKDSMIFCGGWDAVCEWYTYDSKTQEYSPCGHPITSSDDFLKVPAKQNITDGQEFDTVYYCLRSRSQKTLLDVKNSEGNDSTIDGDYMFNICRYMIIYHNPNTYGPKAEVTTKIGKETITKAIITNDEIEQRYEVLERLNFDYNKPGSKYTVYPHPLPWADASYGYTYPETPDLPHNRLHAHSDFPNHGEYGLINRIPEASHWGDNVTSYWHPIEQHGGAENGYMIYCDGMSSSGQVAALSLTTHLCSGQKMFFSAYVCNPSSQKGKSDPNFIFTVQGSTDGNKWDDITSYMTGGIKPYEKANMVKWSQIYFPIIFNEAINYQHFRVRIYNVSSDWDGNDFIIDDLCIFATKPPLIAYQAQTTCKEYGKDDSNTHVLLRVDYQGITGEGYNNAEVFYTVQQQKNGVMSFVDMDYINKGIVPSVDSKPDTIYGKLFIPAIDYEPTDPDSIFKNMTDLIYKYDTSGGVFNQGYIYEILEGDIRPVKYTVHTAAMDTKDDYSVHMSGTREDMLNSICGMTSRLKISSRMVLELDGQEQPETEQLGLCANSTYDLSLRVKGSMYLDSVAPIEVNGSCYNDWLLYGDTAEASSLKRYGYKYKDIVTVVKDILRCEPMSGENKNQFAPNFASISRNELLRIKNAQGVTLSADTIDVYAMLDSLVTKGFLILYKSRMTASVISGDSVQYIIMPIVGSGTEGVYQTNVDVCPNPIFIKLKPTREAAAPLTVGGLNRDSTELSQPVVALASAAAANSSFKLRVDSIISMVGIYSIDLRSTDDPNFREGVHTLSLTPDKDYPADADAYYNKGDSILLRPSWDTNYRMRAGYSYTFNIVMQTSLGVLKDEYGCEVGIVPFTLSIVPDYLRWNPKNPADNRWNNPDNWIGITKNNTVIHEEAFFAPQEGTHVLIPAMTDGMPYPELPQMPLAYKDSIQKVGFSYNTCDTIRFLPGAAISNQQRLDFNKVIVDMSLPNDKWALRSAPVKGMLSGDLYMANADLNGETSNWSVGEFDANSRSYKTGGNASFWLSMFNSRSIHMGNGVIKNDTVAANNSWAKVTNALTLSLPPTQGWAVYTHTSNEKDAVVRLPKNDDIYYYFYSSGGRVDDMYEHNLREIRNGYAASGKAGDMAFQPAGDYEDFTLTNESKSNTFIFGNPTLGYIDIWGFLEDNKDAFVKEFHYIDPSGTYTSTPVTWESVNGRVTDTITELQRYLPPMHAIVLTKSGEAATSLPVRLNTSRVVTSASQRVKITGETSPKRRRVDAPALKKGIMTVTAINPVSPRCASKLLLGQGFQAEVCPGEDAVLMTNNIEKYSSTSAPATPFNIYALDNGYGLSIDLRDSILNVPLSFYNSDMPYDPVTHLWFTGVNNIDGQLVLFDSISGTQRPIIDGIRLDIETPEQNHQLRYYIRCIGWRHHEETADPGVPTDMDEMETEDEYVMKYIYDGKVYILRRGHVYTILGQKVR